MNRSAPLFLKNVSASSPFAAAAHRSRLMSTLWSRRAVNVGAANASSSSATASSTSIPFSSFQRRFHGSSGGASSAYTDNASKYNLFAQYIRFCNEYQMTAAIVTSFVLWSLGDVITQKMETMAKANEKKDEKKTNDEASSSSSSAVASSSSPSTGGYFDFINYRRLATTAAFGVGVIGIGGFYWYRLLDRVVSHHWRITPETSGFVKFTAAKLGLEFALWHPITLGIFWMMLGVLSEDKRPSEVLVQLKTDLPTALAADMSLWLPIDILNFRYTPVHLQVIVVNLGSLFEAVLLSYLHGASGHGHGGGHGHDDSHAPHAGTKQVEAAH